MSGGGCNEWAHDRTAAERGRLYAPQWQEHGDLGANTHAGQEACRPRRMQANTHAGQHACRPTHMQAKTHAGQGACRLMCMHALMHGGRMCACFWCACVRMTANPFSHVHPTHIPTCGDGCKNAHPLPLPSRARTLARAEIHATRPPCLAGGLSTRLIACTGTAGAAPTTSLPRPSCCTAAQTQDGTFPSQPSPARPSAPACSRAGGTARTSANDAAHVCAPDVVQAL
eukprot:119709-Chlamydomonas_euryale.AAC.4